MQVREQITLKDQLIAYKANSEKLRTMPKAKAKAFAIKSLIESGILNTDGSPKKVICTID
jgi:hypothetical protein